MGRAASKVYRVAVNILNKRCGQPTKCGPPAWGVWQAKQFFLFKRHGMIRTSLQGLRIRSMRFSCAYSSNTLGSMKIWEFVQYLSDFNPSRLTVLYEVGVNYLRYMFKQ